MKRIYSILAALGLVIWLVLTIQWFRGIRSIPLLEDASNPQDLEGYPNLSVIVPARNEERAVRESIESMLSQDYPGEMEIIAVNDRSTDSTGEILEDLREKHPNGLRVFHVDELPWGWLGKNYALGLGAANARGKWLLFTDADVRFSGRCFEDAVGYATLNDLDHLALLPEIVSRGVLLKGFVAAFELIFTLTQKPWRVGDPRAKEHVGIGAFNLVRREVYSKIGTHNAIAMRPDDDMKLAKLAKKHGFRQGVAFGTGLLDVEWHTSLGGAVRGLSKSIFPGVDYRLSTIAFATLLLLLTNILPFVGIVPATRTTKILFGSNVLLIFAIYGYQAKHSRSNTPLWCAALHPLSVCIWTYAMWRSALTTLANDGIEWRGTKYALELLRTNVV